MPSSYTPQQKAQISQFVGFTSTKDSVAAKHLKSHGWNVEQAIDANTRMLTAEEQWNIIRKEEMIRGGRTKKKTMAEQLEDMGGFGVDPDSEQAVREELECPDIRPPLQQPHTSSSEIEVLFGESYFQKSLERLFRSWIFQAGRPYSWIEMKDLPLFFRFALRRPIMDERTFQLTMETMGVQLDSSMGCARQPYTKPIGRSRKLMLGIDVNNKKIHHPSHSLKDILPKGATEDMDRAREEAMRIVQQQDDEDRQELMRGQLRAVYEHVQDGSVPLETATWHYRDAFDNQDMSDEILVISLEQFGIPTDHIPSDEQNKGRGSAHLAVSDLAVSAGKKWFGDETTEIITELTNYIRFYRDEALQEDQVIPLIQQCLVGYELDAGIISDVLTDVDKDDETAALLMWEDALDNDDVDDVDDLTPSSSSAEEDEKSYQDQKNPLRAVLVPDPQANEENDHAATTVQAMSIDRPLTGSPANPAVNLSMYSQIDESDSSVLPPATLRLKHASLAPAESESSMLPPGTPRPKHASLATAVDNSDNRADPDFNRESPGDRASIGGGRPSSPDEGRPNGIWGLLMPIKEARKLAYELKLPEDTISKQVRSVSPRRLKKRRASHAKTLVTFPKSKRKASMVLHKDASPKSPRHSDHWDIFAREGEDQETFVLSHFDPSEINPKPNRTRPKTPKQSVALHAYLARVLDDDDVLASIKQLEQEPNSNKTIAAVGAMLHHIRQSMSSGKTVEAIGNDDWEVARLLDGIISSSQALSDYYEELGFESARAGTSTKGFDGRHDGLENGPALVSSLLDSSPGRKHVPASPSGSAASATAFGGIQSNAANGAVFQANNTSFAEAGSPHISTPALDPSIAHLEPSSEAEDAAQTSRSQPLANPNSSAAGESSRTEAHSASPRGVKCSAAGGHPSQAELPAESPAGSRLLSTASFSEQVSDHPIDAEGDMDDTSGAPLVRKSSWTLSNAGESESEASPPSSPWPGINFSPINASLPSDRARAKQPSDEVPTPSPKPSLKRSQEGMLPVKARIEMDKSSCPGFDDLPLWPPRTPSPTPSLQESRKRKPSAKARPGSKKSSRKMNAVAQSCLKSPDSDRTISPPKTGVPGQAGKEWMGMTPTQALEHARKEAFDQRKSFAFYLEERRAVRDRIKREKKIADSELSNHSFFQSSNGSSGSSGTTSAQALNKLFDKYRDNAAEEPDKIGIEGSMRYLTDLGVKLDEVVVLAILTELAAPTMGEFTREGFVHGWQIHRAETIPKQQGQIASFRRSLAMTPDFFKRVYKQTFLIARLPGQKIVPLDTALEYWRLLFIAPSLSWNTANTPWLTYWLDYLDKKWKKSVGKDMWDQTGVFMMKSLEDESMSWWSEDGAWPGVLDEFVFYVREKRGKAAGGAESEMDVG